MRSLTAIALTVWTTLLILLAVLTPADAVIRHVPQEYTSIQSAFNAVCDDDTVLVSLGTYAEELTAPPMHFWFIGDVPADTGGFPKPVIDPSTLDSALWRRCMTVSDGCELTIERMGFVNRASMYPREGFNTGGIVVHSHRLITFRYCSFDSVYRGIVDFTLGDSAIQPAVSCLTEDCRFTHAPRVQVRAEDPGYAQVRRCYFEGQHCVSMFVYGGQGSIVEECVFTADSSAGAIWLQSTGQTNDLTVRNCVFGPIDTCSSPVLRIAGRNGAVVEGNLLYAIRSTGYRLVALFCDSAEATVFRHNYLRNDTLYMGEFMGAVRLLDLWPYATGLPSAGATIDSNVFENCVSTIPLGQGKALALNACAVVRANRFSGLLPDSLSSIAASLLDASRIQLRYNQFEASDYAVSSPYYGVDAVNNYWGDPSGPFNANYNPAGRGARVDDAVLFDPWSPDTNFLSIPRVGKPLPEQLMIEAYPNPFNPSAILRFALPQTEHAKLTIYDVTGRLVRVLTDDVLSAGEHRATFDGSAFASGVYFARLEAGKDRRTEKLMLLK